MQGGQILAHHFSSASPQGLFTVPETSAEAQTTILASLDSRLTTDLTAVCDSPLTLQDLSAALSKLPRGKHPGSDGLPYEFYQAFWPLLGPPLLAVFLEAFASAAGSLTPTQLLGTVVLLYKGTGPRSDPASYRPITLLNADAKLLGKVLADRWGAPLSSVVDTTQTAFLPDRWIGDNILAHLEEVDYLESTQEPGCLVFLDFSKAYDRLDRNWVDRCMAALGFGPAARRWVSLLHDGLQCRVRYNGWLSPSFPVSSGLAQGSPLSPLLYVAAAQPLAAHLRQEARLGHITPISLPDGSPAPPCHQHADDTTLHLRTRADVSTALQGNINLFCAASGSQVNPHKSQGLVLGPGDDFSGVDTATSGIPYSERGASVRHLGVRLSTDPAQPVLATSSIHRLTCLRAPPQDAHCPSRLLVCPSLGSRPTTCRLVHRHSLLRPSATCSTRPCLAWPAGVVLVHDIARQQRPGAALLPCLATLADPTCLGRRMGLLQALEAWPHAEGWFLLRSVLRW